MLDKHQPRPAFIEDLERQIESEARRRNRLANTSWWPVRSPLRLSLAAGALALVSMAVGGAAVAATYQAQNNERRDQVVTTVERRLTLEREGLQLAMNALHLTEEKVRIGLATKMETLEAQSKVSEAQARVRSLESQVQEARLTGREPLHSISAPLVSGQDFVGDRLRLEMLAPRAAAEIAAERLRNAQMLLQVGVADALEVDVARANLEEIQAAVRGYERKIDIRQRFIRGEIDGVQADLRALEGEAEQRRSALLPKVEVARRQVAVTATRVRTGRAQNIDLVEASLRVQQLEADLAKADFDLAVIRQRLGR